MKAEDRYEALEPELKNLITPMSEVEQEMLMKAIRWACYGSDCGRMSALAKLLVWSDPNTNVGGIWSVEDVNAQLEYMESNEIDVSFVTHEMKQQMLQDWYDYISENDSNLWGDFVYSRVAWLRNDRGYFQACAFADLDGNVSWDNHGGIWFDDGIERDWVEDDLNLTETEAIELANLLNAEPKFRTSLDTLPWEEFELFVRTWNKQNIKR